MSRREIGERAQGGQPISVLRAVVAALTHRLTARLDVLRAELLAIGVSHEVLHDTQAELRLLANLSDEQPNLPLSRVDLTGVIAEVVEEGRRRLAWNGVRLELGRGTGACLANRKALALAVRHLLANAVEAVFAANGGDGMVELDVERSAIGFDVVVRDTGPGIDDDLLEAFRQPALKTTKRCGAGLGIAFVFLIARAHGAGLAVESRPGGGTIVRLQLVDAIADEGAL